MPFTQIYVSVSLRFAYLLPLRLLLLAVFRWFFVCAYFSLYIIIIIAIEYFYEYGRQTTTTTMRQRTTNDHDYDLLVNKAQIFQFTQTHTRSLIDRENRI